MENDRWVFFMFEKPTRKLYVIDPMIESVSESYGSWLLQWFTEIHHGEGRKHGDNSSRDIRSGDPEEWNSVDHKWSVEGTHSADRSQ